jgi:hypothetical protein
LGSLVTSPTFAPDSNGGVGVQLIGYRSKETELISGKKSSIQNPTYPDSFTSLRRGGADGSKAITGSLVLIRRCKTPLHLA